MVSGRLAGDLHGTVAVEAPVAHFFADDVSLRIVDVKQHLSSLHHQRPLALGRNFQTGWVVASRLSLSIAESAGIAELAFIWGPRWPPTRRQR